ncbi:dTDP-4-dehydrorhamnose 3,5-epimerase [Halopseudomonas xinjiangensis]|uniref:dTDP-4-dehydrorhamnose 3,5-epimerase n=1 Tax=Halopseudomonas xinjiangensis TaxID=487184 RepID=A0A1H1NMW3_9GAMM|nr:dTDP-4-dehydrorhamnose 3,5-epimerase [Halopseudomonas xinjiangensis]SDS00223.1 dTDP-4-dehydrorhamnose 3,5-epimerase [Halopseudomonas xinjiangensis]
MKFIPQSIPDVVLCQPKVHGDHRGYFTETFRQDLFEEAVGHKVDFVQDNESSSTRGVLRGLHFQLAPHAQSKLVRVIKGAVLDVAVDIRKGSPTFGQHVVAELTEENKHQLFVPRGFAHGFVVLSEQAIFAYKVDNYYSPECDRGLAWDDPAIGIDWHIATEQVLLSEKDTRQPKLAELKETFDYGVDYYA